MQSYYISLSCDKVFARPEAIVAGHANYAAQISSDILKFFEEEFGTPYTVGKLGNQVFTLSHSYTVWI